MYLIVVNIFPHQFTWYAAVVATINSCWFHLICIRVKRLFDRQTHMKHENDLLLRLIFHALYIKCSLCGRNKERFDGMTEGIWGGSSSSWDEIQRCLWREQNTWKEKNEKNWNQRKKEDCFSKKTRRLILIQGRWWWWWWLCCWRRGRIIIITVSQEATPYVSSYFLSILSLTSFFLSISSQSCCSGGRSVFHSHPQSVSNTCCLISSSCLLFLKAAPSSWFPSYMTANKCRIEGRGWRCNSRRLTRRRWKEEALTGQDSNQ